MSDFELLAIHDHRELVTKRREILARLNANPELAALLIVNPVLALREAGVDLSKEATTHVLRTVYYSSELRQKVSYLLQTIESKLKETPRPNDPCWVSELLFQKLQLQPLETEGLKPAYVELIEAATMERLQALRPKPQRERYPNLPSVTGTALALIPHSTARRLDLDAALPPLNPTASIPNQVSLEMLYFYKDSHPLVRDLLELGIVQRQAFPIQTADSFRQIRRGEKTNALFSWVRSVRFPETLTNVN